MEERLQRTDGELPCDEEARAQERERHLREAHQATHHGAHDVCHEVRAAHGVGEGLRRLTDAPRARLFLVECANHDAPGIRLFNMSVQDAHRPLLARGEHERALRDKARHDHGYRREDQEHRREHHVIAKHHEDSADNRANRHEHGEQTALQHLGHLVEVVRRAAHDVAGFVGVEILEREHIELLRDSVAKLKVEAFCKARHGERLKRVERPCNRPDAQEDEALSPAGIPADAERRAHGERLLDVRPQQVDEVGAVCRRGDLRHRVAHDAHEHHGEAPVLPARCLPQAPHHGKRIARHLGVLLCAHIFKLTRCLLYKFLRLEFL